MDYELVEDEGLCEVSTDRRSRASREGSGTLCRQRLRGAKKWSWAPGMVSRSGPTGAQAGRIEGEELQLLSQSALSGEP